MAGASLAAECAPDASVVVLEAEDAPGYHATGRSAAFWEQCYGGPDIVPLTLASGEYLRDGGFLDRRGALYIAREADQSKIEAFAERFAGSGARFSRIDRSALKQHIPGLHDAWRHAIWQPDCADIDVAALHAHYLAAIRRNGGVMRLRARLNGVRRRKDVWELDCENGDPVHARTLVNAAGPWADPVAQIAGAAPCGIQPLRRTVVQLRCDPAPLPRQPLALDISGGFYFKPESGRVWLSPHDETPSAPCDAAPEELAVAEAVARFEQVVDWRIGAVERSWAGLRSFTADRRPVYGFDPAVPGFFWFAGQGGFGIQTAPAAARLGSQLLLGKPRDAMTAGLDAMLYSPARFGCN
ncbi:NAD(P)/FAD-dependent oxidoreductase [Alteripontixanthobacter maritimus]